MSDSLLWELTKRNTCFLVKRGDHHSTGVSFSADPLNLTKVNSFKASGLANSKAIGSSGKSLLFKTKRGTINKITYKNVNAVKIENTVSRYRVDLCNQAVKAIVRANEPPCVIKPKKVRGAMRL